MSTDVVLLIIKYIFTFLISPLICISISVFGPILWGIGPFFRGIIKRPILIIADLRSNFLKILDFGREFESLERRGHWTLFRKRGLNLNKRKYNMLYDQELKQEGLIDHLPYLLSISISMAVINDFSIN